MADEIWSVKRCLDWTRDYLKDKGEERPRLAAELLLTGSTGLSRVDLYTNFDKPMSAEERRRMHDAVVRRAKGEPIQYIVGSTGFRTLEIQCEPGVLIPRPETEMLVEEVLSFLDREVLGGDAGAMAPRQRVELPWNAQVEEARRAEEAAAAAKADAADDAAKGDGAAVDADAIEDAAGAVMSARAAPKARVLEVGCGTGCISLSIAAERAGQVSCVATDINPAAVELAKKNAAALGISSDRAAFREGDLVSPVTADERGTFDVLVSNPPYIPTKVMGELPREVAVYEPESALAGGQDGLDIFRRLVDAAPGVLRSGGLLACELYEGSLDDAAQICHVAGMRDIRIVEDLTGRPRIILARIA